jgi:hypothetical protein
VRNRLLLGAKIEVLRTPEVDEDGDYPVVLDDGEDDADCSETKELGNSKMARQRLMSSKMTMQCSVSLDKTRK